MRVRAKIALALLVAVGLVGVVSCSDSGSDKASESSSERSSGEPDVPTEASTTPPAAGFALVSDAFEDGAPIGVRFANTGVAGGANVSPPLAWSGAPAGTESFALLCVDLHPVANEWVHWMVVDIPAATTSLPEGASNTAMPAGARELANTSGRFGWGGPQPPPGSGDHEYRFTLYALPGESVDTPADASLEEFESSVAEQALGSASVSGFFGR